MRIRALRGLWGLSFIFLIIAVPLAAQQQAPNVNWVPGPAQVDLGKVAQLELADGYVFLNAADARKLLAAVGNVPDGSELGLVAPAAEDQNWFVVFDYNEVGYVRDDEKDEIDAAAILKGIREGTEEANKVRKQKGVPGLHVVGWQQEPYYDAETHNLSWAILAKDDEGDQVVNFNVRLLGRRGYVSATLVDDATTIAAAQPHLDQIVSAFSYRSGNKYAEFRSGDKVAEYGLMALVAGGAGAAAAKTGLLAALGKLLAKAGKAIVLLVVGAVAAVGRLLKAVFGNDRRAV
jgi:uncharacterized membrane-anchored protein